MKRNKRRLFKGGELYLNLGNIGYTRHRTKTNKKNPQKTKKMSNTDPTKKPGGELMCSQRLTFPASYNTLVMLLIVNMYWTPCKQTYISPPTNVTVNQIVMTTLKIIKFAFVVKKNIIAYLFHK
jgi:hypothetical protein